MRHFSLEDMACSLFLGALTMVALLGVTVGLTCFGNFLLFVYHNYQTNLIFGAVIAWLVTSWCIDRMFGSR